MPFRCSFAEAYEKVIEQATEGVDVENVYRNLGLDPEFIDDVSKLAVALVIINSGCVQGHAIAPEVDYAIKVACRNLIEHGQVEQASPEVAAETMDKMRSMI